MQPRQLLPNASRDPVPDERWREAYSRFFKPRPFTAPAHSSWQGRPAAAIRGKALSRPSSSVAKILSDSERRPQLTEKVESLISKGLSLNEVRQVITEEEGSREGDGVLTAEEERRLDEFRTNLVAASKAEEGGSLHVLIKVIMAEYDHIIAKLQRALTVTPTATIRATIETMQREIYALLDRQKQSDVVQKNLLDANRDLQAANSEYYDETVTLQRHVNELHDQLQKATQRLFITTSKQPEGDQTPSFSGLTLHGKHTAAEYINGIRRMCLEIEHLRAANYELALSHTENLQQFNAQQNDLNSSLARGNELTHMVSSLKEELKTMKTTITSLEEEREALKAECTRLRVAERDLEVMKARYSHLERELAVHKSLISSLLEKKDPAHNKSADDRSPAPASFPSQGMGSDVPIHLRARAGKVKNKNYTKQQVLQIIRDLWAERSHPTKDAGHFNPFAQTLVDYAAKKTTSMAGSADLIYSLCDSCERIKRTTPEAELLLAVLGDEAPEALHPAFEDKLAAMRNEAERAEKDKGRGGRPGRLSLDLVLRVFSAVFPNNPSAVRLLEAALLVERGAQEEYDIEALLTPPSLVVDTVLRCMMLQHNATWLEYFHAITDIVSEQESRTARVATIRGAMVSVQCRAPDHDLDETIRVCVPATRYHPGAAPPVSMSALVNVYTFLKNLRTRCYLDPFHDNIPDERSGAVPPRKGKGKGDG
eukprot:Sspe_Gene.35522::Locus_17212_Transcript_1_1_Confidence_1.000_Length_2250::g.35522::m.35522